MIDRGLSKSINNMVYTKKKSNKKLSKKKINMIKIN